MRQLVSAWTARRLVERPRAGAGRVALVSLGAVVALLLWPGLAATHNLRAQTTCSAPSDAYASAVLADAPAVYYPLNESSGLTMCDASGNGNNGTYWSSHVTYGVAGPLPGDVSQTAVEGDGLDSRLLGTGGTLSYVGDRSFTLEGWFRWTGTTSNEQSEMLVAQPGEFPSGLGIWHDTFCGDPETSFPSTIGLDEYGISNCWDTSSAGVDLYDGGWHDAAVVFDQTSDKLTAYVDGQSLGAQTTNREFALDVGTVFVGNWVDTSVNQPFVGDAAQIAVYPSALSAGRIAAHYTAAGAAGGSPDARLSALSLSAGTISPAFATSTTSYTLSVPNSTSSTTVTATSENANATLSLTSPSAASLSSGASSSTIPLAVGANTITVHSVAQDGVTVLDYTVTVTRAAGTPPTTTTPSLQSQTVSFASTNPSPVTYTDPSATYDVRASATSGLEATISIDSSSTSGTCVRGSVHEVSGAAQATITFTGTGTCVIDAGQGGNATYAAAPTVQQQVTVALAVGVPDAPTGLTGVGGVESVKLTWTKPASDGGKAITGYKVLWRENDAAAPTTTTVGAGTTSDTVTGLTDGRDYEFAVAATNASGTGPASGWISKAPTANAPPPAPTLKAKVSNGGTSTDSVDVILSWSDPTPADCSTTSCEVSAYTLTYDDYVTTEHNGVPSTTVKTVQKQLSKSALSTSVVLPANQASDPFTLVASNSFGLSPKASINVVLGLIPDPPQVTASGGVATVTLVWDYNSSRTPVTSFHIYEGTGAGRESSTPLAGSAFTETTATLNAITRVTATVTGLNPGTTYYFTVTGTDASGTSARSSEVSATTDRAPSAPLGVTAIPANREIMLDWSAPSAGGSAITGYDVYAGTSSGGEGAIPVASTTSTNVLVRNDPAVIRNGTTYYFTVRAVNAAGEGDSSNEVSATPEPIPGSPNGLTAKAEDGKVALSWGAPSSTGGSALTGYDVYEGTAAGKESTKSPAKTVSASATSATVTGLTAGKTYFFYVTAVNASGASLPSSEASATPAALPGVPVDVVAMAGNRAVLLRWSAPTSNGAITGYEVYEGTSKGGEGATPVASPASTSALVRNDPAVIRNGTTYYFTVRAVDAGGTGDASSEVSATPEPVPGSPSGLSATAGAGKVTLNWSAPSSTGGSALTGYDVYEGTASGNESATPVLTGVSASATSATVTGLTGGTTYFFYVTASNGSGASFPSTEASAIPTGPPGVPDPVVTKPGPEQVTVSWSKPASDGGRAISGYTLLWRAGSSATAKTATLGASVTSDTVTGLTNGKSYQFAVEATNPAGTGAQSSWLSTTPTTEVAPLAPGDLTARVDSSSVYGDVDVKLSWTAPPDAGCSSSTCALSGYVLDYTTYTTNSHGQPQGKDATATVSKSALSTSVELLDTRANDTFSLVAKNAHGKGAPAMVTVVLEPLPPKPVLTATPGPREVKLSWTVAMSDPITAVSIYKGTTPGGESSTPLAGYHLTSQSGHGSDTTYTATVGGLTDGTTYYFKLAATDQAGTSPTSTEVSASPADVPGKPTGLTASAGNDQVTLKWTAPAGSGGAVTGYDVYAGPTSGLETRLPPTAKTAGSATGVTLTEGQGIFNGFTYYIVVAAVNASGIGLASSEVTVTPSAVPESPTDLTAIPDNRSVLLSWSAPASAGASPITGYDVYEGTSSGGEDASPIASTTSTSVMVRPDPELDNGTTYYFTVRAVNGLGVGNPSSEVSATPEPIPGSPTGLGAKAQDGEVTLSWSAPSSTGGGPLTGYDVYEGTAARGESATPAVKGVPASATSVTVGGLTDGTTYFFYVTALNASGASLPSSEVSATPAALPGAPSGVVGFAGNEEVLLSWAAPSSSGGSAITGYEVFEGTSKGGEGGAAVASTTSTRVLVRNDPAVIRNGTTYYFTVRAVNAAGTGAASSEVSATPEPVPGSPTGLSATAGNGTVTLKWSAPSSTGGSALTGYDVYEGVAPGKESATPAVTVSASATGASVTGLSGGTAYYFYVTASNAAGAGYPSSEASASPTSPPGVPVGVTVKAGPEQVTVSWSAPASDGGRAITGYTVLWRAGSFGTVKTATLGLSPTSDKVTGLTDGTSYQFAVEATNAVGAGPESSWFSATPTSAAPPPAPTLSATVATSLTPGDVRVTLTWSNPTPSDCTNSECRVSGYTLTYEDITTTTQNGVSRTTVTDVHKSLGKTDTSTSVDLPASGASDPFELVASNTHGSSPATTLDVVLAPPPNAPPVTATAGTGTVVLKWRYGASAVPITGYDIYEGTSAGGESSTPLARTAFTGRTTTGTGGETDVSVTVTGLTSGVTYYFIVTDTDAGGTSAPSREVSATAK